MCFLVGEEDMYDEIGLIPQRLDLAFCTLRMGLGMVLQIAVVYHGIMKFTDDYRICYI